MSLNNAEDLILYIGSYDSVEDADADYLAVKELHSDKLIGTYDAAVVTKTEDGKVKIAHHTEKPTQHGGLAGLGVGAVVGLLWPGLIVGAAVGAAIGAVAGHIEGGISRGELKELGALLDEDDAALVVIAEPTLEKAINEAMKNAKKEMKREVKADAKDLKKAIDELPA